MGYFSCQSIWKYLFYFSYFLDLVSHLLPVQRAWRRLRRTTATTPPPCCRWRPTEASTRSRTQKMTQPSRCPSPPSTEIWPRRRNEFKTWNDQVKRVYLGPNKKSFTFVYLNKLSRNVFHFYSKTDIKKVRERADIEDVLIWSSLERKRKKRNRLSEEHHYTVDKCSGVFFPIYSLSTYMYTLVITVKSTFNADLKPS